MTYYQITSEERYTIAALRREGFCSAEIARRLGRHRSTISNKRGRGEMTKSPITLQELRRRIYVKAKAEKSWRFLRQGFGWKRWSRRWMYATVGLFTDYRVRYLVDSPKDAPAR